MRKRIKMCHDTVRYRRALSPKGVSRRAARASSWREDKQLSSPKCAKEENVVFPEDAMLSFRGRPGRPGGGVKQKAATGARKRSPAVDMWRPRPGRHNSSRHVPRTPSAVAAQRLAQPIMETPCLRRHAG